MLISPIRYQLPDGTRLGFDCHGDVVPEQGAYVELDKVIYRVHTVIYSEHESVVKIILHTQSDVSLG